MLEGNNRSTNTPNKSTQVTKMARNMKNPGKLCLWGSWFLPKVVPYIDDIMAAEAPIQYC